MELIEAINARRAALDDAVVEQSIFGTSESASIAKWVRGFCEEHLGCGVANARFYRVSVACVFGLDLMDGRSVVVKAQRGTRSRDYLSACFEVRRLLVRRNYPCPAPIGEPVRASFRREDGEVAPFFTAEDLVERGEPGDGHEPGVRSAMTDALAQLILGAAPLSAPERLGRAWFLGLPEGRVFPRPHSPIFQFERDNKSAEWIIHLAAEAREIGLKRAPLLHGHCERVVGHFDFRVEHLRFEQGRIVTSFDWDSLHYEFAAVLIGSLAPHFTADWQRSSIERAPSLNEMKQFVRSFETSMGRSFSALEMEVLSAASVFAMAYTARCNHASSPKEEGWNGDLRPLLRQYGKTILECGLL